MSKKFKILSIVCLAFAFIAIDLCIFFGFTWIVLPPASDSVRAKSIEVQNYLPFDEHSEIVRKKDATFSFEEGEKPVVDCATALYPVASSFVYSLYDEGDVINDGDNFLPESKLQLNNTVGAYKRIVDGTSDIGLLAKPSKEQLDYASSKGVELKLVPIGYEAFVFLVNVNNPVESLTTDEVRGIYTGKYSNWNEFCDFNKQILPIQRVANSGSQTTFLNFMKDEKDNTISRSLNRFGSPIGYSFRFYVEEVIRNGKVKAIGLNGVQPTKENIINKTYPVVSDVYAVYSSKNTNPNTLKVVDWIKSEMGQSIIDECGYVKL